MKLSKCAEGGLDILTEASEVASQNAYEAEILNARTNILMLYVMILLFLAVIRVGINGIWLQ